MGRSSPCEQALGIKVYFAKPYHSWERGDEREPQRYRPEGPAKGKLVRRNPGQGAAPDRLHAQRQADEVPRLADAARGLLVASEAIPRRGLTPRRTLKLPALGGGLRLAASRRPFGDGSSRHQGRVCRTRLLWRRFPLKSALQTQTESAILPINHKEVLARLCCATSVALATGWRDQKSEVRQTYYTAWRRNAGRSKTTCLCRALQHYAQRLKSRFRDEAHISVFDGFLYRGNRVHVS